MYGHADHAHLVREGVGECLADPPIGVGAELAAAPVVILLDGTDEAEVALLDEVEQRQLATAIALGHGDHEAQVGLDEARLGGPVTALDATRQ